jgi:hypothetical protein
MHALLCLVILNVTHHNHYHSRLPPHLASNWDYVSPNWTNFAVRSHGTTQMLLIDSPVPAGTRVEAVLAEPYIGNNDQSRLKANRAQMDSVHRFPIGKALDTG